MLGRKTENPIEMIRNANRNLSKLRDARSKLDRFEHSKKIMKINNEIHMNKEEIRIAEMILAQPKKETNYNTTTFNVSKNDYGKHTHFHGHLHTGKQKKK